MIGGYFDFENVDDDGSSDISIPDMEDGDGDTDLSIPSVSDEASRDTTDGDGGGDLLAPPYGSPERQSTLLPATFNLIATIVGGGVLSLPWAFSKCGIGLATLLMILSAYITNRSLHLLIKSSRQSGASSYGEVGKMAFNNSEYVELFISGLLFIFLLFVVVAYMVILRDIWTPIFLRSSRTTTSVESSHYDNQILLFLVILLLPFLIQRTLHSLRWNCYIGFASVSVLCYALCHHGFQQRHDDILWFSTTNLSDVLLAIPIILLTFLCHFNILPIQANLMEPSRERMSHVVDWSVGCCFILMYFFGLGGYLYAGSNVQGNILLHLISTSSDNDDNDWMFFAGRIGCGITIFLAIPMMVLPCRDSWLELVEFFIPSSEQQQASALIVVIGERTSLLRDEPIIQDEVFLNPYWYYGSTIIIIMICYIGAVAAPGVAIVWTICGSFMAFFISFIFPSACYLKIGDDYYYNNQMMEQEVATATTARNDNENDENGGNSSGEDQLCAGGTTTNKAECLWRWFSIILLIVSTIAAIACTWETIRNLVDYERVSDDDHDTVVMMASFVNAWSLVGVKQIDV